MNLLKNISVFMLFALFQFSCINNSNKNCYFDQNTGVIEPCHDNNCDYRRNYESNFFCTEYNQIQSRFHYGQSNNCQQYPSNQQNYYQNSRNYDNQCNNYKNLKKKSQEQHSSNQRYYNQNYMNYNYKTSYNLSNNFDNSYWQTVNQQVYQHNQNYQHYQQNNNHSWLQSQEENIEVKSSDISNINCKKNSNEDDNIFMPYITNDEEKTQNGEEEESKIQINQNKNENEFTQNDSILYINENLNQHKDEIENKEEEKFQIQINQNKNEIFSYDNVQISDIKEDVNCITKCFHYEIIERLLDEDTLINKKEIKLKSNIGNTEIVFDTKEREITVRFEEKDPIFDIVRKIAYGNYKKTDCITKCIILFSSLGKQIYIKFFSEIGLIPGLDKYFDQTNDTLEELFEKVTTPYIRCLNEDSLSMCSHMYFKRKEGLYKYPKDTYFDILYDVLNSGDVQLIEKLNKMYKNYKGGIISIKIDSSMSMTFINICMNETKYENSDDFRVFYNLVSSIYKEIDFSATPFMEHHGEYVSQFDIQLFNPNRQSEKHEHLEIQKKIKEKKEAVETQLKLLRQNELYIIKQLDIILDFFVTNYNFFFVCKDQFLSIIKRTLSKFYLSDKSDIENIKEELNKLIDDDDKLFVRPLSELIFLFSKTNEDVLKKKYFKTLEIIKSSIKELQIKLKQLQTDEKMINLMLEKKKNFKIVTSLSSGKHKYSEVYEYDKEDKNCINLFKGILKFIMQ